MLESLSTKLRSAIRKLVAGSADKAAVDELVAEIERAMIASDVDVKLAKEFGERIKARAFEKIPAGLTRREHVVNVVYDELTKILGGAKPEISLKPKRVLLAGLFGSGKTSTAAKLARWYQKKGLRTALVCCDTARPAAYQQLQQLAAKIGAPFYGEEEEKDASKIMSNALKKLRAEKADIIIADSSGRDALDENLVKEIKRLNLSLEPQERILVLPADIGQAAREQAKAFQSALGITDVIITKLDATAKGGGALAACKETGAKVKFVALGETPEDLEIYDSAKFVARLIGMPDLETLLEKAQAVMKPEAAEKIIKAEFDLDDFVSQIEAMQKMGPLKNVIDMLGMGGKIPSDLLDIQEGKMKTWKHIMSSMTKGEKANPDIIDAPRIVRIAKGSGRPEAEVRELLASYGKIKKMMKSMGAGRMRRGDMSRLLKGFKM